MKRLENYQKPTNNDTHGYDGPIAISNGGSISGLAHDFLRASDAVGIPFSGKTPGLSYLSYLLMSIFRRYSRFLSYA
jgi:alcohol oxidase